jgi:hypothetical protein
MDSTILPSTSPTIYNATETFLEADLAAETHNYDAISSLVLNITIIGCLLLAYFVKRYQIYYLPERCEQCLLNFFSTAHIRAVLISH